MSKYRRKEQYEAVQFLYIDGIDGPETIKRAKELGLSRNGDGGISKIWEIHTNWGWKIVEHGSYIMKVGNEISVIYRERFEELYESVGGQEQDDDTIIKKLSKIFAEYLGKEIGIYVDPLEGEKKERAITELGKFLEWFKSE
jgi:hypothetical protein